MRMSRAQIGCAEERPMLDARCSSASRAGGPTDAGDAVAASIAHELGSVTAMVTTADAVLRFLYRSVPTSTRPGSIQANRRDGRPALEPC